MTEVATCPHCGFDLAALDTFSVGDLEVQDGGGAIFWRGDKIALSPSERLIVTALARAPGHLIRRHILAEVIGYDGDGLNIIAVLLTRINRAFRHYDREFTKIETVWGQGIRWRNQ